MTLILQSNKIATRSLGNVDGIIGPRDFSLFSDFSMNRHFLNTQAGRVERSFMDLYSFSRPSSAEYMDESGNPASVASGVPRLFHNIPGTGTRGLLIESARINSFKNPTVPVSQVVPLINGATYCVIFSMTGPGSLTVTGDITDTYGQLVPNGLSLTVTAAAPGYAFIAAPYGETGNINVQVNGNPSFVQVERADRPWTPSSRIVGTTRSADRLAISSAILNSVLSSSGDFTVAMHVVDNYASAHNASNAGIAEARPVFQAIRANGDHIAMAARTSDKGLKSATVRVFMSEVEQNLDSILGMPDTRGWTAVMARGGSTAYGGISGNLSSGTGTVLNQFKPDEFLLGRATTWASRSGLFGVLTKLVVYPRFLSPAEIKALSSSWM